MTGGEHRHVASRALWLALLSIALITPTYAQVTGVVRGTIADAAGDPVAGANVTIELQEDPPRRFTTTTNDEGQYSQIGLPSGSYAVTAERPGGGRRTFEVRVRIGQTTEVDFQLVAGQATGGTAEPSADTKRAEAVSAAFEAGVAAAREGRHDEAIAKFTEALDILPTCHQCYYNVGVEQIAVKRYDAAEAAFRKAADITPDYADAYRGLATIYNAQRRFDEAEAASERAAAYASGTAGVAGGSNATDAIFGQAIILWNAGKIEEARTKLQAVLAADPSHAEAHYWLGMAHVNEGHMAEAATMFERYLELAPDGQYAAQAKGILAQVKP